MGTHIQAAVADAINAACYAAKAGVRLYNAVCEAPGVLDARQQRGLFGLGKHLAGDPTAADYDCIAIDLMLNFVGSSAMSPDERYNLVGHLSQEASARLEPKPGRLLASTEDIALCLAFDAAALIRLSVFRVARSAANLDVALEWAQEGDTEGEQAIPIRLLLDAQEPVGLAISAARIVLRVFVNSHRAQLIAGVSGQQWAVSYDAMLAAARSDIQSMMASIRAVIESPTPDPSLASPAPYLARELSNIAHNVADEVNTRDSSTLGSVAENASTVADLAAEAAEAYDTALKTVLT